MGVQWGPDTDAVEIDRARGCNYSVGMPALRFAWHRAKAAANLRKHGVSFEEAQTVFLDDYAVEYFDEPVAGGEERFLLLGISANARLLLVCHCYKEAEDTIRIISARKATKAESQHYTRW